MNTSVKAQKKSKAQTDQVVKSLHKALDKTGLLQYELAALIGCLPSTLNRWLKGKYPPSKAWRKNMEYNEALQKILK